MLGLGSLESLPLEIRRLIYSKLLTASRAPKATSTWGPGSGISIDILCVSRQIYSEALPVLYEAPHTILCVPREPPAFAIRRMQRLTFEVRFKTQNRGDYEEAVDRPHLLYYICDKVGLSLRQNTVLKELYIILLNENQRKRGPKPLRSQSVKSSIQRMLLPFATLPSSTFIEITGFDTLDFAEMFDEMRETHADSELPISMLLNDLYKRGSMRQSGQIF